MGRQSGVVHRRHDCEGVAMVACCFQAMSRNRDGTPSWLQVRMDVNRRRHVLSVLLVCHRKARGVGGLSGLLFCERNACGVGGGCSVLVGTRNSRLGEGG